MLPQPMGFLVGVTNNETKKGVHGVWGGTGHTSTEVNGEKIKVS